MDSPKFATSSDGRQIAFEVTGSGPPLLLLHGGGQSREVWRQYGYVERLAPEFTVITMDQRGHRDSAKPERVSDYAIERLKYDISAVADAARAPRFLLWGYSYGANIGRFLAAQSDRVRAMIYVGIPFGAPASANFRKMILDMRAKWLPILERHREGRFDPASLAPNDQAMWASGRIPAMMAWFGALLAYPAIKPNEMRCPTLWVVGTANEEAMTSVRAYRDRLHGTRVRLELLEGMSHAQELERADQTLAVALPFLRANAK